ncbi:hypothetical protein CA13_26080 [Planctomycetes bacterium CA13]|uniref:Methyltransferase domain-containing protein n=1 Tax=Novipirellula herctigrandis TaxID=2527986 RepID=A0A5C5Z1V7_9BACT|nr:hypothetical protein CA13_26080 [Planctomycetes bacterium CA13]
MSIASKPSHLESLHRLKEGFQAEDGHCNPPGYQHYLEGIFHGINLQGRRVLEIGSGRGLISLHCGLSGAERVVSIEPEMEGSTSGVVATQAKRIEQMGLSNIELRNDDFNKMDFGDQKFDVIVMIAVLNHLYETPLNAMKDSEVFDTYVGIGEKLHGLLASGGVVIATDATRYCLWTQLRRIGYPRQFCLSQRTINWRIHQQPSVWKKIFSKSGFDKVDIDYPIPYRFRHFGSIVATPAIDFFLSGEFILRAYKS